MTRPLPTSAGHWTQPGALGGTLLVSAVAAALTAGLWFAASGPAQRPGASSTPTSSTSVPYEDQVEALAGRFVTAYNEQRLTDSPEVLSAALSAAQDAHLVTLAQRCRLQPESVRVHDVPREQGAAPVAGQAQVVQVSVLAQCRDDIQRLLITRIAPGAADGAGARISTAHLPGGTRAAQAGADPAPDDLETIPRLE